MQFSFSPLELENFPDTMVWHQVSFSLFCGFLLELASCDATQWDWNITGYLPYYCLEDPGAELRA